MPSPVAIKVSAEFAESVRAAAAAADRSLTGQIEHWAKVGRAAEAVMPAPVASALKRCAGDLNAIEDDSMRRRVIEALDALREQPVAKLRELIGIPGQTLFESDPKNPGGILRISPDGTRTRGTMKGRTFIPATS